MLPDNEQITGIGVLDDNVLADRETFFDKLMKALHLKGLSPARAKDKRGAPRFSISVPISYHIDNGSSKKIVKSVDLSETGVRIAVDHPLEAGTRINLEIKLPNMEEFLKIKGIVVWTKPSINTGGHWDCGVAFEDLRHVSKKEKIISLIADQHCRFALIYTRNHVAAPVDNFDDVRAIYKILYKEYIKRQLCAVNHWQMHYTYYSLLPTTRTFQIKDKDKLLGTISLIGDSAFGLPMEATYPEEIKKLRAENRKLAEVGFLTLDASQFKKNFFSLTNFKKQAVLFRLYKIMFDYARFSLGATDLIIGIKPKHETLYNYLQFETIAGGRAHSGAEGSDSLLLRMDIPKVVERNLPLKVGPGTYFLRNPAPMEVLNKKMQWTHEILLQLLLERKPIWDGLTAKQRESFEEFYPGLTVAVKEHKARHAATVPEKIIVESYKKLKRNILQKLGLKPPFQP